MCEVLDRIENCGIDKGKAEGRIKGRTQVMALMKKLFQSRRINDGCADFLLDVLHLLKNPFISDRNQL